MLVYFIYTLSLLLLGWLGFGALYQFTGALAGLFYKPQASFPHEATQVLPSIRVFIPACREDAVIEQTARRVLSSDYPKGRLEVLVIADGLRPDTLWRLRALPLKVLEVHFEKSTKSKALNAALAYTAGAGCDMAVVLDADNAPAPDFLKRAAHHFLLGARAMQGRRVPKLPTTPMALLDAASEDANNHILCRGARALGFSARLAGSGMAFEYALFSTAMATIDAVGGFDKALEGTLTSQGICIEYDEKAIVFDEKVSQTLTYARQRGRWMAAQFRYGRQFLPMAVVALIRKGQVDFFYKALQMALPPRLLAPGALAIGTAVSMGGDDAAAPLWALALLVNVTAFGLALPRWLFQKRYFSAWLYLPQVFVAALWALLKMPQASRVFVVTPKNIQ